MYCVIGQPVVDQPTVERRLARCAGRRSAGSTRTSRRTCPSCRPRASPGLPHCGQAHVQPLLVGGERRHALRPVVLDVGEQHRQLVLGDGHRAAVVAVDDRDRAAPVALPREAPVAQAVGDRRLARAPARAATRRSPTSPRRPGARRTRPELTSTPSSVTTSTIGRSNVSANSRSRSSCAGTAMIAPVP